MIDPVRELKVRAEILHHAIQSADGKAIERLRALDEWRRADDAALRAAASKMQRKHCLAVVARETGFATWDHARRVLDGDPSESDFGTLLYGSDMGSRLHSWFNTYEDARARLHEKPEGEERRYLLAHKRHFFIVNQGFIKEPLGCDPFDADWASIDWDWVRPTNREARRRLYGKLLVAQRRAA